MAYGGRRLGTEFVHFYLYGALVWQDSNSVALASTPHGLAIQLDPCNSTPLTATVHMYGAYVRMYQR